MNFFHIPKFLMLAVFVLECSCSVTKPQAKDAAQNDDENEESSSKQNKSEKQELQLIALTSNVESVTSLVKAQSEIIENLSDQVSSISKETGNEKFQQVFDEIAKHSGLIHDVTKQLDETIMQVNKLVGKAVEMKGQLSENLTELEGKIKKNEESIKRMEGEFTQKIEKLQQMVKTLSLALQYTGERNSAARTDWPIGKYCILANGSCPRGFLRYKGHYKSLYLSPSPPKPVKEAKLENKPTGSFGYRCGSLTLVTCCK